MVTRVPLPATPPSILPSRAPPWLPNVPTPNRASLGHGHELRSADERGNFGAFQPFELEAALPVRRVQQMGDLHRLGSLSRVRGDIPIRRRGCGRICYPETRGRQPAQRLAREIARAYLHVPVRLSLTHRTRLRHLSNGNAGDSYSSSGR